MGGPYALDAYLRHPTAFGSLGVVQPAFGLHRVAPYADRLAEALSGSNVRLQLLSSTGDPFVEPTTALARALEKHGRSPKLRVLPGPHDQPWLREAGTIEMLLFHERGG
jgi:enterochelin esterase-like enzyme